ncbi:MAG: hypothetical protein ACFFBP_17180 [Promethearchaeota archaeon]
MSILKKLEENLQILLTSINDEESIEKILENQQNFTRVIEDAMEAFQKGNIKVDVSQALPKVMYGWAVNELPNEIKNPEKHARVKNQLILFMNTIENILRPEEC